MILATSKSRTPIIFLFLQMKKESKHIDIFHFVRLFTFQELTINFMKSRVQHVLLCTCHVFCLSIACPPGQGAVQFSLLGSVR